jgi:site-specific DNA-methyltransferase (adenine-specific)
MTTELYLGDCLEFMKTLKDGSIDAVIADPPYGMDWPCDGTRFKVGKNGHGKHSTYKTDKIAGDNVPFDPSPFLDFNKVIMWGFHHFSDRLPTGSVLIWLKKLDGAFGSFLSDADLAWMKGGEGVYCFRDQSLLRETRDRLHPTQKPLPLMRWCIQKVSNPGDTIFDPFMGSGTTGVACMQLGRNFIGCEIDPNYFAIAEKRIHEASLQPQLFSEKQPEEKQVDLFDNASTM